ncbi:MAG: AtpZ/AtpI family protein [Candidatus Saccharimonas sp.]
MSKLPGEHDSTDRDVAPSRPSALYLIATMADTTWRMFVPTIVLILVGDWLDRQQGTKPWLMLAGAIVGAIIATYLIKRQLQRGKEKVS